MKLLVFAHAAPPDDGESSMVKLMLDAFGGDQRKKRFPATGGGIGCYHVDARITSSLRNGGNFSAGEFLLVLRYCLEAIWCRFRYGVKSFYYIPAPGRRGPLYRDWVVMLLCRPFFRQVIFDWRFVGLGDWLENEGGRLERWISHRLLDFPALSLSSAISTMRDGLWFQTRDAAIVPEIALRISGKPMTGPSGSWQFQNALRAHFEDIRFALQKSSVVRGLPMLRPKAATFGQLRPRLNVLQVFSRYEAYGGEESSVYRMADAIRDFHNVEYFLGSTEDFLNTPLRQKSLIPLYVFRNLEVKKRLRRFQEVGRFDLWQVHNVFPALSPIIYELASEWGIPIVHFLHNYRFGCTNGFFINHGKPCERCINGNFWPALATKAWHDSYLFSGMMGAVLSYSRSMGVFQKVTRWIAISECQKLKHVEMGIPAENITVLYHFYTPKRQMTPPAPNGYALFVGRLSPEKGVAELISAWSKLGKDRNLVIMGDGPESDRLKAMTRSEGMTNVTFLGFIPAEEQQKIWNDALFSVVPSIWLEPFGMVVLESWSQSRAVVAHRIGALPELITHGQTGLLAEPFDRESLAATLDEAFSSPQETNEMGVRGRRVLEAKFSQREWLSKILKIYEAVT